ncbi:N-formylglutamate amidohydrolase [Prosthecomicrobium sp. N25]
MVRDFSSDPPFEVLTPDEIRVPFLFNSPHSGTGYPQSFLDASRLDGRRIRRSEDSFVDELFGSVPAHGAPLMRANFPRAYLDVNREPYELDPKMFTGRLPAYANVRSLRVAGGLGTIARIVAEQEEIYARPLEVDEALERIEGIYKPYHAALRKMLARLHVSFGYAVLVDCHSMPSVIRGLDQRSRPDIVLGDRYGTSCWSGLVDSAVEILTGLGYAVARNKPYAGGFITEHYGRPGKGLHALQIEINRALYMNEDTYEPHAGFGRLAADLSTFVGEIVQLGASGFRSTALAAE